MIETYLSGSIRQSNERAHQLRNIAQSTLPREYDGLRQICLGHLTRIQDGLNALSRETVADPTLQTPLRLRKFKRLIEGLNAVENVGIFALKKVSDEDIALNRIITEISTEISYPLINPVVSHMSQEYLHIFPGFNLLCLPLLESNFLLHLPDIYHELCHPLHRQLDLPKLAPYASAFQAALIEIVLELKQLEIAADRLVNQTGRIAQFQMWRKCWVEYWMEEFFCDLFGIFTVGPAYAWAHYHLCAKRGDNPFATPVARVTAHPADDARMRAMVAMLRLFDEFETDASNIDRAWRELVTVMQQKPNADYYTCFPDRVIDIVARTAKKGIHGIAVKAANSDGASRIRDLLNNAWRIFWEDPNAFSEWEKQQARKLRELVPVDH